MSGTIEYFEGRKGYFDWHTYWPIAWNIKMYGWYDMGKGNEKYDERWDKYLEENPDLFFDLCQDALSGLVGDPQYRYWHFFEGHNDPDLDNTDYSFEQLGRSGGHLVLREWRGYSFLDDEPDWSKWDENELRILRKFCAEIDDYVGKRYDIIAELYNEERKQIEAKWRHEEMEQEELDIGQVGPTFATL